MYIRAIESEELGEQCTMAEIFSEKKIESHELSFKGHFLENQSTLGNPNKEQVSHQESLVSDNALTRITDLLHFKMKYLEY